jgi:hypothetical protein
MSYVNFTDNGDHHMPATKTETMIPLRTLEQVKACLARDKARSRKGERIDLAMARLMLKAGRLTAEARAYVEAYR